MGIKLLNSFLKEKCPDELSKVDFKDLSGKKIVIDASIYMYKFLEKSMLLENTYLMCMLFRHYNILPLFVFDGKPPAEKKQTILNRKRKKEEYLAKCRELEDRINNNRDFKEQQHLQKQIDNLRKRSLTVKYQDIEEIKQLLDNYGIQWVVAEGEADILCARLVQTGQAYACLSEDMDLLVYGCPRVLRYMSLIKHNFVIYDIKKITNALNISFHNFQIICILSGTDYNISKKNVFYFYRLYRLFSLSKNDNFKSWLDKKMSIQNFKNVLDIFNENIDMPPINIEFYEINKKKLKNLLTSKNFVVI